MNNRILVRFIITALITASGSVSARSILNDALIPASQGIPDQTLGGTRGAGLDDGGAAGPYGEQIFLRGSFNDGAPYAMSFDGSVYAATIDLDAGGWDFNIGSGDWASVMLGDPGSGNNTLAVDSAQLIGFDASASLFLEIGSAGRYTFSLDATSGLESPTLLVTSVTAIPEPATLVLIGLPLVWVAISRRRKSRGF